MKKILAITFSGIIIILIGLGCSGDIFPPENIKYETANDIDGKPGGSLRFTWAPYSDSVGISVDGVLAVVVSSSSNEAYVYVPGTHIEVSAILDGKMAGYSRSFDFPLIETPSIDVWSIYDPDPNHLSGFGFGTNGTCAAYSLWDQEHFSDIDFYIDAEENKATLLCFASPHLHTSYPLNTKHNSTCQVGSSYSTLKILPAPTSENFSYATPIQNNGVYGFWLDDDGAYDTTGHFVKAQVIGIDGDKVNLKLAYQMIGGLRWVVLE
jgi:hypothetical protein